MAMTEHVWQVAMRTEKGRGTRRKERSVAFQPPDLVLTAGEALRRDVLEAEARCNLRFSRARDVQHMCSLAR